MSTDVKRRKLIEEELAQRRERLFSGSQPVLLEALRREIPSLVDAIIVDHIPKQFEDVFAVLIDPDRVAIVEIAREPGRQVKHFRLRSAFEYGKGLSKRNRRQFIVAREMIRSGGARTQA